MGLDNVKFSNDIWAILLALELAARDRYHDDYIRALNHVAVALRLIPKGGDCYDGPLASTVTPAERRQREEK